MARYVHKSGIEYSTGLWLFALVVVSAAGIVGAGAIAAIPVLFGAIQGAAWVWGILSGLWTGLTVKASFEYRGESRKLLR